MIVAFARDKGPEWQAATAAHVCDAEAEARAAALKEAIAAVGKLRAYKLPNVSNPFVEYAAVLEALRGKRKGEA